MFTDTINKCAANAARIAHNPLGFWVSSAMAGAYVGLGIILIFTLGNLLDPSVRPLVMGATYNQAENNYFIGLMLLAVTAFLAFLSAFLVPHGGKPDHAKK